MSEIRPISAEHTWPIRHTVMWPDHPLEFVKLERDLTDGLHYGLFVEEELTSIISLYVDGAAAQFRKFATLKSEQNKGYGSRLLTWLIEEKAVGMGIEKIWCNARTAKISYYEKFGLRATEATYEKGGIHFTVLEKLLEGA